MMRSGPSAKGKAIRMGPEAMAIEMGRRKELFGNFKSYILKGGRKTKLTCEKQSAEP